METQLFDHAKIYLIFKKNPLKIENYPGPVPSGLGV
jgi:hypothetical protein